MTQHKNCAKCGNEFLAANETDSACPKCLAQFAMGPTEVQSQTQSGVSDEPVLPAGTKLGQYEIKAMLGRGGMGTVYKAYQLMLDRFVAIKILPAKLFTDPEFVTRFNREAKALAGLSHPNIVGIYDIGQEGGYFYFVMEFVEGVTVRQLIEERKLPPEEAMKIVPQLCEALEYAHSEGVVHRDIKPENILVDKNGRIKIADFGLARIVRGDIRIDPVTRTQEVMGTLDYMAPEQRMKSKDVDLRVDIYSLGVVFYEMLTGELPIGKFEVPSRKVQIDVRIDDIVMKTLEREPSKRYQRVSEVGTAVSAILSGTAQPLSIVSGQTPRYSTLSILSLALSFIPACITQLLGIIFGIVAIRKINRSAGQLKGTGLAIAGIVSSIVVGMTVGPIILAIAIPNLLSSKPMVSHQNEKLIPGILEKLALAQELYKRADLDGNNKSDYCGNVTELVKTKGIKEVIFGSTVSGSYSSSAPGKVEGESYSGIEGELIALADTGSLTKEKATSYQGYFYMPVYMSPLFGYDVSFAIVAYPEKQHGKTYVIDERGIIYSKFLGNLGYPSVWDPYLLIDDKKVEYDPTKDGWQVEKRVEISDTTINDTYQQIRKVRPELPEKLSSPAATNPAIKSEQPIIQTVEKLVLAIEISYKAGFFGGNYPESVKQLCELPGMDVVLGPDAKLIAQADQGTLGNDAQPYNGYFFKMVPYEIINQEPYFPGSPFTLAAYPANQAGKTFICDERRIIYAKDLGPVKYPDKWKSKIGANYDDYDPTRDGWQGEQRVELSDENFINTYKKMRAAILTTEDKVVIEKLRTTKISTDILRKPSTLPEVLGFISKELNIRIEDKETYFPQENKVVSIPALWFNSDASAPAETILKTALMGTHGRYSYFVKDGKIIVCDYMALESPLNLVTLEDGISQPDKDAFAGLMMDQVARILEQRPQEAKGILETIGHFFPTYNDELDRRYEQLDNKILVKLGYVEYLESGKKLMAQGKYQEALNAFTQAQGIHYTPGVKVMIGQCQEEIKKLESEQKPK